MKLGDTPKGQAGTLFPSAELWTKVRVRNCYYRSVYSDFGLYFDVSDSIFSGDLLRGSAPDEGDSCTESSRRPPPAGRQGVKETRKARDAPKMLSNSSYRGHSKRAGSGRHAC